MELENQELSKAYDHSTEPAIFELWEKNQAFSPDFSNSKPQTPNSKQTPNNNTQKLKPIKKSLEFRASNLELPCFSMVLPPPNVTGSLHMGHALNTVCQDILARYYRLQGRPVKWIVGTDHAGIATQTVVEKDLLKKGIKARELPKDKFIEYIWEWKKQSGDRIIEQLQKLGASCDFSKIHFTMDDDYKLAVETAFKRFYDKGWIYRANRVINWCVRCQTSLSDLELEYHPQNAKLYFFRYDQGFPITIATTRPETKLGDSAVAVNPKDKRYTQYIGNGYDVNFAGKKLKIKVIADPMVDIKFGTGALGVTPAHSLADQELAQIHKLDFVQVIDKYGRINANGGKFSGLKVAEAREKIVEELAKNNLIEKTQEIEHNLSVCYRCAKEIEPIPSRQWFMKMEEIKKPAMEAVKSGKIKFTPKKWEKIYLDWMENVRDWCISRQLVWGHRLPIFFCQKKMANEVKSQKSKVKSYIISSDKPEKCPICNDCEMEQSSDVLDTWFSSALWAFATQGYPGKLDKRFYPTSVLSTARDIINLWVARMIFCSIELTGQIPFETVYIHPTIFNKEGKRMSKSLGTGVDPMDLTEKYGIDAVRFGLAYVNTGVQDLKFDEEAIKAGQKFANKVWNVARFVITSIETLNSKSETLNKSQTQNIKLQTEADEAILEKLDKTQKSVAKDIESFRFGQAAHTLYDFIWHDFADIYIENSKSQILNSKQTQNPNDKTQIQNTLAILLHTLTASLKLLHPFMPFVTEAVWQELYKRKLVSEKLLITKLNVVGNE